MKPYLSYKDSGVEWIGEIPNHWEVRRVATFGTFSKGRGINKDEIKTSGIPCIRYGEIYTEYDRIVFETVSFIDEESSQSSELVKKGDVLFTGSGETIDEIGKTVVYYGDDDIFVGGDVIILKLKDNLNPLFISYMMNSKYVNHEKSSMGRGEIVVHIYSKQLKEIKTTLPPLPEQQQIVEYLDEQTQKIDELIEKTEKKIELLKEKRTSLINHCVTKGLNPNVEMKDSEVDWIGEIPRHWDTIKCGYLFKVKSIKNTKNEVNLSVYRDYGVILRDSRDDNYNRVSDDTSNYKLVEIGDFVFNKMKCWMGSLGVSEYRGIVSPSYTVCETTRGFDRKYFYYLLRSTYYIQEYEKHSYGVRIGQWELHFHDFKNMVSLFPPLTEQKHISEFLNNRLEEIDKLIEKETQRIELLKEYHQSLISEVVTGKIDVRDEVVA